MAKQESVSHGCCRSCTGNPHPGDHASGGGFTAGWIGTSLRGAYLDTPEHRVRLSGRGGREKNVPTETMGSRSPKQRSLKFQFTLNQYTWLNLGFLVGSSTCPVPAKRWFVVFYELSRYSSQLSAARCSSAVENNSRGLTCILLPSRATLPPGPARRFDPCCGRHPHGPYQPVVKLEPRFERPFSASSALQNLERSPIFLRFCASI